MPPFCLQKSTKTLPKIDSKMHRLFDRFLHRFFFDFASILEANLEPCWPLFRSKHSDAKCAEGVFCWVYLLFRFLGRPGPFLAPSGLDLGGFGPPFWRFSVPIFFTISKFFDPGNQNTRQAGKQASRQPGHQAQPNKAPPPGLLRAVGVTRSAKNFQVF